MNKWRMIYILNMGELLLHIKANIKNNPKEKLI